MAAKARVELAEASSGTEESAWSVEAALNRAAVDGPLSEADRAHFWWVTQRDELTHWAAKAIERLKNKDAIKAPYLWLANESIYDLTTYPPVDEYRGLGHAFIDASTASDLEKSGDADRSAAEYLIDYADLVDLTDGFAGASASAPQLSIPVEIVWMCERLRSSGEAFCPEPPPPEQNGSEPAIATTIEDLRQRAAKGGKAMSDKAAPWRNRALEISANLRTQNSKRGNYSIAVEVKHQLEVESIVRDVKTIERLIGLWVREGSLPPSQRYRQKPLKP